jgi:hypothetical protein
MTGGEALLRRHLGFRLGLVSGEGYKHTTRGLGGRTQEREMREWVERGRVYVII